jgi:hypothetical protein
MEAKEAIAFFLLAPVPLAADQYLEAGELEIWPA